MKFRIRRLFDAKFYLDANPDLRDGEIEPWQHYCEFGHREDRDPHPLFSSRYYRQLNLSGRYSENPLVHYLRQAHSLASPHPLFDAELYVAQVFKDESPQLEDQSILEHFLAHNHNNLASPSPLFDTRAYVNANPEIAANNINALYHFSRFGIFENRESYIDWRFVDRLPLMKDQQLGAAVGMMGQYARLAIDMMRLNRRASTILSVSMHASTSDSVLRALHIAQRFRDRFHVNVVNLLCENGPLRGEFLKIGPTFCLEGSSTSRRPHDYLRLMRQFKSLVRLGHPVGIFANSVTSEQILSDLGELQVPIHALVHDNVNDLPLWQLDSVNQLCERVVFPSAVAKQKALENSSLDPARIEVIQPGLPEPLPDSDETIEIRKRLEIANRSILVLGVGDESAAKGLDLFVSIALSALRLDPENRLHFAWTGNTDDPHNARLNWARKDVELAGFHDRISFLGNDISVEKILPACDIFLLTSRSDAFPTSVMQAMSAAKPIVLFDRGNGCRQLVTDRGGTVVSYGDIAAAAVAIQRLADDDALRERQGLRNQSVALSEFEFNDYVVRLMRLMKPGNVGNRAMIKLTDVDSANACKKRRVIFCSPSWSVSGVNTFVEELGKQLIKRDFDVSILFTTIDSTRIPDRHLPALPYHYLSNLTLDVSDRRLEILRYLQVQDSAVVIPNFDYVASSITAKLPDHIRTLGILHSDQDEHYLHAHRVGHYWDRIITVSAAIQKKLLGINPGFAVKTKLVRYGIPVGTINQKVIQHRRNSVPIRLIYTGRIVQRQKRIFDFVDLAKSLNRREIDFRLTLAGEGEDLDELTLRMQPFIERGQVRLPGRLSRSEIVRELTEHHAFCLLSEYEGLPLSMLEAMATECVPVVTRVDSGISEILTHYRNGMLSPVRDVEAMAENIQLLHENVLLRKRLGMRARTTLFRHRLTTEQMADDYADILNSIFDNIQSGPGQAVRIPLDCPTVQRLLDAA